MLELRTTEEFAEQIIRYQELALFHNVPREKAVENCVGFLRAYARQQAEAMRERAARLAKSFERSEMASHSEVCGCPEVEHAAMWEVQDRLAAAIRALEVETHA